MMFKKRNILFPLFAMSLALGCQSTQKSTEEDPWFSLFFVGEEGTLVEFQGVSGKTTLGNTKIKIAESLGQETSRIKFTLLLDSAVSPQEERASLMELEKKRGKRFKDVRLSGVYRILPEAVTLDFQEGEDGSSQTFTDLLPETNLKNIKQMLANKLKKPMEKIIITNLLGEEFHSGDEDLTLTELQNKTKVAFDDNKTITFKIEEGDALRQLNFKRVKVNKGATTVSLVALDELPVSTTLATVRDHIAEEIKVEATRIKFLTILDKNFVSTDALLTLDELETKRKMNFSVTTVSGWFRVD